MFKKKKKTEIIALIMLAIQLLILISELLVIVAGIIKDGLA